MLAKYVNKKNAGKPRFLVTDALLHTLAAFAATSSAVAFCWCKATAKVNFARIQYRQSDPGKACCPTLTPTERVTRSNRPGYPALAGQPTYHVNVIKLKWEIIWIGRVTSPNWGPPPPCKQALISKKATLHVQHTFLYISLPLFCTTTTWNFQKLLSYTFYGGNVARVLAHPFFHCRSFSPCIGGR